MKTLSSKNKKYIVECKMNDAWWPIGDDDNKDTALDLCKYKKKCQSNLKWRVVERVTVIKETILT